MKFPDKSPSGIGTMGLLGITLLILVSTGQISNLWMIASVFFIMAGIGSENKS